MSKLPDIYYARSSIIWLRVIASLAWLDSALVGKDAKLSYAFLSGVELAKRISETFVFTAVLCLTQKSNSFTASNPNPLSS